MKEITVIDTHTLTPNPGLKPGASVKLSTSKGSGDFTCTSATEFQAFFKGQGKALAALLEGASKGSPVTVQLTVVKKGSGDLVSFGGVQVRTTGREETQEEAPAEAASK